MEKRFFETYSYTTLAALNIRFDAMVVFLWECLSETYTTFLIPDCIINFAHSLHGNNATYIVQFFTSTVFLFRIAFVSAWHTENIDKHKY